MNHPLIIVPFLNLCDLLLTAGRQSYILVDDIRVMEGSCTGESYITGMPGMGTGTGLPGTGLPGTGTPGTGTPGTGNCNSVNKNNRT